MKTCSEVESNTFYRHPREGCLRRREFDRNLLCHEHHVQTKSLQKRKCSHQSPVSQTISFILLRPHLATSTSKTPSFIPVKKKQMVSTKPKTQHQHYSFRAHVPASQAKFPSSTSRHLPPSHQKFSPSSDLRSLPSHYPY